MLDLKNCSSESEQLQLAGGHLRQCCHGRAQDDAGLDDGGSGLEVWPQTGLFKGFDYDFVWERGRGLCNLLAYLEVGVKLVR